MPIDSNASIVRYTVTRSVSGSSALSRISTADSGRSSVRSASRIFVRLRVRRSGLDCKRSFTALWRLGLDSGISTTGGEFTRRTGILQGLRCISLAVLLAFFRGSAIGPVAISESGGRPRGGYIPAALCICRDSGIRLRIHRRWRVASRTVFALMVEASSLRGRTPSRYERVSR